MNNHNLFYDMKYIPLITKFKTPIIAFLLLYIYIYTELPCMENNLPNTVAKLDLLLAGNNHFSRAMWIILFNKTIILFASVGYEIYYCQRDATHLVSYLPSNIRHLLTE